MKEMIEKLKKMSLIKKIITIYTVVVIFPVFMLVSYLSMVQYEKLYTETAVSYTHLDVYKRQIQDRTP